MWTPPQRLRDDRELVRSRLEAADSSTRTKLQVLSMLKRRGIEKPEWHRGHWTKRWISWLREIAGKLDRFVGPVLANLIARFELYRSEMTKLERHIRE